MSQYFKEYLIPSSNVNQVGTIAGSLYVVFVFGDNQVGQGIIQKGQTINTLNV